MIRSLLATVALVLCFAAPARGGALLLDVPERVGLGQPFEVRVAAQGRLTGLRLDWLGRDLRPEVADGRALALLGTDVLDDTPGTRTLTVRAEVDGKKISETRQVLVAPHKYPVQKLTLPPKMVTPPAEVLARIAREQEDNRRARELQSARRLWTLPLARPVPGELGSVYGAARILNGQPRYPHRGLDFRAAAGDPVRAVAPGRVVLVGDEYYAGRCVFVDHGNGVVSMYFHLSRPEVREGQRVDRGQVLGLVGATGRATGPHLHFSLAVQGCLIDPAPLLESPHPGASPSEE